jgi:hypothetical protein
MTTDVLDRVAGPGTDLLARVDAALLDAGAPARHPVWPVLRRVRALPGAAFAALLALRPETLHASAAQLRVQARGYLRTQAGVGGGQPWSGPAARGYEARWEALRGHLGETADPTEDSLAGRLAATAAYLDELADWVRDARAGVALAVAAALGSAEAVALRAPVDPDGDDRTGQPHRAAAESSAAAAIAAHVLDAVVRALDDGDAVARRWSGRLGELPFREPPPGRTGHAGESMEVTP